MLRSVISKIGPGRGIAILASACVLATVGTLALIGTASACSNATLKGTSGGNARAWLLAITRNTAFTWLARNRSKAHVTTEDIETQAPADGATPKKP